MNHVGAGKGLPLVIFDCDGVLVDSETLVSEAESELLATAGVSLTAQEISERFVGLSEESMISRIKEEWGVVLGEEFRRSKAERLSALLASSLRPVDGIAGVLASVQPRAQLCVASSSGPERVRLSLDKTGLAAYFGHHIFTATMVRRGKPAPDLFLLAAGTMGVGPANCVVVEDSPFGVAGAVAAGMKVLGFSGGSHCSPATAGRLAQAGADRVVGGAEELSRALAEALDGLGRG